MIAVRVPAGLAALSMLVLAACGPSGDADTEMDSSQEDAAAADVIFPVTAADVPQPAPETLLDPQEVHLANVRQLTFGGQNAEAYFSFDGQRITFQSTPRGAECDQIFSMNLDGSDLQAVSTGFGRTTCSYYYPAGDRILYASTHEGGEFCPAPPDFSRGYVWAVYASYDIFVTGPGGAADARLTDTPGYDAEATFSPQGDRIVFTSMRDGDLDLYAMNPDGSDVVRLTDRLGYDGGAFYSPDGSQIVWRAHYPESEGDVTDYSALLAEGLIRPSVLELWVMDADGSNKRQITNLGAASFGPFWHPSGEKILFSSNTGDPQGREFDLYLVNLDGSGLERVTYTPEFDGFPVFSPDGTQLVWGSNRASEMDGETNVFVADWVESH